jgi:predicted Zn-dependent protease
VISTLTDPPRIQESVTDLRRAIALDSNNPEGLFWLVANYGVSGKCFAARPFLNQLLAIDPLRPPHHVLHGHLETMDGQFDEALEPLRKASKMDPSSPSIHWHYAMALLWSGAGAEADAVIEKLAHDAPGTIFAVSTLFLKYALAQEGDKARSIVTPELRAVARRHPLLPLSLVEGYALLGENDDAFAWLEIAAQCGFINYPFLAQADPLLEDLRQDPRFGERMENIKQQWQAFEV